MVVKQLSSLARIYFNCKNEVVFELSEGGEKHMAAAGFSNKCYIYLVNFKLAHWDTAI